MPESLYAEGWFCRGCSRSIHLALQQKYWVHTIHWWSLIVPLGQRIWSRATRRFSVEESVRKAWVQTMASYLWIWRTLALDGWLLVPLSTWSNHFSQLGSDNTSTCSRAACPGRCRCFLWWQDWWWAKKTVENKCRFTIALLIHPTSISEPSKTEWKCFVLLSTWSPMRKQSRTDETSFDGGLVMVWMPEDEWFCWPYD